MAINESMMGSVLKNCRKIVPRPQQPRIPSQRCCCVGCLGVLPRDPWLLLLPERPLRGVVPVRRLPDGENDVPRGVFLDPRGIHFVPRGVVRPVLRGVQCVPRGVVTLPLRCWIDPRGVIAAPAEG